MLKNVQILAKVVRQKEEIKGIQIKKEVSEQNFTY